MGWLYILGLQIFYSIYMPKIMKIGWQLTKLLQKLSGLLFFGPPCMSCPSFGSVCCRRTWYSLTETRLNDWSVFRELVCKSFQQKLHFTLLSVYKSFIVPAVSWVCEYSPDIGSICQLFNNWLGRWCRVLCHTFHGLTLAVYTTRVELEHICGWY